MNVLKYKMRGVTVLLCISAVILIHSELIAQCMREKIVVYERSYDAIFASVIETCNRSSFIIKDKDYNSGMVSTEFRKDSLLFSKVILGLSFKLEKLDEYKTKVILTILGQKQDASCFSGKWDYIENTAIRTLESILYSSGCTDLNTVLLERKNAKREKPLLIFNFCSEEVRSWRVQLKINNFPPLRQDFVSGGIYELETKEGPTRIEYSLASRESCAKEKRFQTKGRPFSGALQEMVINLNLKKGDIIVFKIIKTGKELKAYSCMPGGGLIPPLVLPYKYEEVNFTLSN